MPKLPPVPKEQRNVGGERPRDRLRSAEPHRRDRKAGVQSPEPGDAGVDLEKQGRYRALRQNLTPQQRVQDR
jgi:hypothetical protein